MAKRRTTEWMASIGSLAVSGWALVFELLVWLQEHGLLSDREAKRIIQGARDTLNDMRARAPHPSFDAAVEVLDEHLARWRPKKKR